MKPPYNKRKHNSYNSEYESTPEQIRKRSQRNKARREYEQEHGKLPSSVDVDHKKPIKRGGSNATSNLRARSQTENRGWRKGRTGAGSYEP